MEERLEVDGIALAVHYARPATTAAVPALVLCHDFPTPPRGSLASGLTFPELADRIARDVGLDRVHLQLPRDGRLRR